MPKYGPQNPGISDSYQDLGPDGLNTIRKHERGCAFDTDPFTGCLGPNEPTSPPLPSTEQAHQYHPVLRVSLARAASSSLSEGPTEALRGLLVGGADEVSVGVE
jgi:hypothetical protein